MDIFRIAESSGDLCIAGQLPAENLHGMPAEKCQLSASRTVHHCIDHGPYLKMYMCTLRLVQAPVCSNCVVCFMHANMY